MDRAWLKGLERGFAARQLTLSLIWFRFLSCNRIADPNCIRNSQSAIDQEATPEADLGTEQMLAKYAMLNFLKRRILKTAR